MLPNGFAIFRGRLSACLELPEMHTRRILDAYTRSRGTTCSFPLTHTYPKTGHANDIASKMPPTQKGTTAMKAACMKLVLVVGIILVGLSSAQAASEKPNILVIFGDDIGYWNISATNRGMMGYRTPNIDRIAKEGAVFTDLYAQQSCTAGRAAFITGQSTFRTGLLKVGLPGAKEGLSEKDPTLAELLKPQGYATGQFGKNHLGDRNEFLPTVHGFDEFFGNLYHLNAEDEPENVDYPKNPEFFAKFGPRGVLRSFATDTDDPTEDPRWGRVGKQKIENTGPLTVKRQETVDEEITDRALAWMETQAKAE